MVSRKLISQFIPIYRHNKFDLGIIHLIYWLSMKMLHCSFSFDFAYEHQKLHQHPVIWLAAPD